MAEHGHDDVVGSGGWVVPEGRPGPAPHAGGQPAQVPPAWAWPPVPGTARPVAPRPGLLRRCVGGAFAMVGRNPAVTLGLALAVGVGTNWAALVARIAARNLTGPAATTVDVVIGTLRGTGLCMLAGLFAVIAATDGAGGDAGAAVRRALPRLGGLVGIGLVIGLLSSLELYGRDVVPFGLRLLMGLARSWLWILTALAAPVFAVEGGTMRAAFVRSYRLIHGRMWATYGLLLVAQLFKIAVWFTCYYLTLDGTTAASDGALMVRDQVVVAAVTLIADLIVSPLFAAFLAVIFVEYRLRPQWPPFPGAPPTTGTNSAKEWPRPLGW